MSLKTNGFVWLDSETTLRNLHFLDERGSFVVKYIVVDSSIESTECSMGY